VSYAIPVGKLSVEPQDKVKIMAAEIRGTHIDWKLEEPKNAMPNYLSSAIMPMTFQQSAAGCEEKCWAKCDAAYAICEGKCLQSGIESFSCDCSCSGSGVRISTHCKCMPIPH
jgi:hypothetical protein